MQRQTKLKTVCSKLDPKAIIAEDSVALTVIRSNQVNSGVTNQHAMLIIERLNEQGTHMVNLAHLTGPMTTLSRISTLFNSHLLHGKQSEVKTADLTGKEIRYSEKSHTWVVDQSKAHLMMDRIDKQANGMIDPPPFYLLGGNSFLTYFSNYERHGAAPRNCIHWVLDMLRLAGINLHQDANVFATETSSYTSNDNNYHLQSYGITELCDFIKQDALEAIRQFFPVGSVNINELISGKTVGSVEFQLRNYTPLMLACGYGKWDIAKMLINEYDADVSLKNNHGLTLEVYKQWLFISYDALMCAKKNIFGITKVTKDNKGREEVIALIESKLPAPEKRAHANCFNG
ncbi:MAG: ankyrin repeat domain-containing protein [Gammaproteobacteria bacterium]|nr:ankyrin repeat domain-containing protein [Gammaproteobacteria bacterium]